MLATSTCTAMLFQVSPPHCLLSISIIRRQVLAFFYTLKGEMWQPGTHLLRQAMGCYCPRHHARATP